MITFSKLEKKGNLGNQLFQIASSVGIAISNNQDYCFPKWSFGKYFKNELPLKIEQDFELCEEKKFHFHDFQLGKGDYDLEGWFQTERYFDVPLTKHYFEFDQGFITGIKAKFEPIFLKKTILISIRRGDFVDHLDYFQLPINYYITALIENFVDWENRNIVVLSDDINYCKFHFSFLENVYFADNLLGIEQLALASLCDDFIISNSTFSWWCAWLGEKSHSVIIRPLHYFTASKKRIDDDIDYFPERWKIHVFSDKKIVLENTNIFFKKRNSILEDYINHNFSFNNCNTAYYWSDFKKNENNITNSLFLCDVVIPPFCLYVSIRNALHSQTNTICYLRGQYISISRFLDYTTFHNQFDFGIFTKIMNKSITENKKNILFVRISDNNFDLSPLFFKGKATYDIFKNYSYKINYSYSGRIKNFFECYYFITIKKQKLVIKVKQTIKKIFKIERK